MQVSDRRLHFVLSRQFFPPGTGSPHQDSGQGLPSPLLRRRSTHVQAPDYPHLPWSEMTGRAGRHGFLFLLEWTDVDTEVRVAPGLLCW